MDEFLGDWNTNDNFTRTFLIPEGVNVIYLNVFLMLSYGTNSVSLSVRSDNKVWFRGRQNGEIECKKYIGVTPNKRYTVTLVKTPPVLYSGFIWIQYSPEINKQTPTICDY